QSFFASCCCPSLCNVFLGVFFFSSRRRHTRFSRDWSSDVCSSDLQFVKQPVHLPLPVRPRRGIGRDAVQCVLIGANLECELQQRSEERRVGKECRSRWSR